jgi:UDP-N-acetylglucosamine:LPS N-acetylglucosamine transferase
MNSEKKKLMFVYLRTGGGHLAPAKSVANYISKNNQETEVLLVDGLQDSWWFARFVVVDGYRILQNKAKWIFELIYLFNKIKFFARWSAFLVKINTQKYFEEKILKEKPDEIVIFHFLLIAPIHNIIKKHKLNIKVITVVTDPYTAHPIWFLRKDQSFIIFSEKLKAKCISEGIDENNLNVFPFILDEKFSQKIPQEKITETKKRLGFGNKKVLLIVGGGDGIPKGYSILKNILSSGGDFEIALVCGKNKRMYKKAEHLKHTQNIERLKIYEYIDFVNDLLSISDVVITKCGASTFMEILLTGKVPVVNSYIWEQEKGNVEFLVENELGIFEKRVGKLPSIINGLFTNELLLNKYKSNIENAHLKTGVADVAAFIFS